ncbi:MAG TPA: hypothetical protein VFH45_05275, partial [Acidimicrobiales bacterium]|nr:hypothetical protein [Acidimicrobiales bacterium]
ILSDFMFRLPARRLAAAHAAGRHVGDGQGPSAGTWLYEFRWRSPNGLGAVHCIDVPFAFGNTGAPAVGVVAGDDPPASLADDVHGALVRFVTEGDAGWNRFEPGRPTGMVFDVPSRLDPGLGRAPAGWPDESVMEAPIG